MGEDEDHLKIMGYNCGGWPKNSIHNKIDRIHNLLERTSPNLVWILETALTSSEKPHTYHDNYSLAINVSSNSNEAKFARGRGIMAFTKGQADTEVIFPAWHSDRRAFLRVKYQNGKDLITGAFHVNIT